MASIVGCYCARVHRLQTAGMQNVSASDSIFDGLADAMTGSAVVQVAELMTDTGCQSQLFTHGFVHVELC